MYVGFQSGLNSLGGSNLFLGAYAGFSSANSNASFNTFIGQRTGYNTTTGFANIFLGSNAGYSNQSGNYNTFIGNSAGQQSQLGSFNTFIGNGAGYNTSNANYNLFMGAQAGFNTVSGNYNVMLGQDAGASNKSGNNNTFIGKAAGGDQNSSNLENATAIGANAVVSANNAMVLGNNVNVGIGTSAPKAKLEITQGTNGNSGLRFTNLTRASQATYVGQTKFLTVNDQGDVVLGSTTSSPFREAAANDLWKAEGDNLVNTNAGGIVIGPGVSKTPAGYRLYVADGVLTEKVKVAVKSTNDWSDRVFESGYKLRGLKEVEQFINQEKHLPGVPSAEEVVKEGVDVGQMQAKLLEKVEELTLYVIDLKKQNDSLKKKSAQLEQRLNKLQAKPRK
ncbi:bZIP transcription factor [Spirosoma soli]|uniref:BZIP transcription factor n=1 Tax=Spirosoma soli TaxID=1770529 RepID=A0ABW5M3M2_9BACT